MTGVQQAGALAYALLALTTRAQRIDRLKCGRGDRAEQLQQMRAAFGASQQLARLLRPAAFDRQPFQGLEVRRDVAAHVVRAPYRAGFHVDHVELIVDSEPQPHFVQRLSGRRRPAIEVLQIVALGVDQVAFDIPKTVVAAVADTFDPAVVHELAWSRCGQSGIQREVPVRRRSSRLSSTASFSAAESSSQPAISSRVRMQPRHSPLNGFIWQTFTQGEGTSLNAVFTRRPYRVSR